MGLNLAAIMNFLMEYSLATTAMVTIDMMGLEIICCLIDDLKMICSDGLIEAEGVQSILY